MTYIPKPQLHHPKLPHQRAGLHAARLRGLGLDPLRRLRPRLASPPRSSRPASSWTCRRTGSPSCRASAARRRRRTISSAPSHGFNTVHGRMPSVLTGANLANRDLIYLGVSGDGDSASIGFGQFAHAIRRGVNMAYIVENNGVYGLTKGQFSATSDKGSKSKKGVRQHRRGDRPGRHGPAAGRHLRRPQLLRRQGPAGAADQGGDAAQGRGLHRLHQPLRRVQQPRRARPRASTTCASTTRR